jgi:saccharopine dehydrogenase (NAD+, L-lysine-forming)
MATIFILGGYGLAGKLIARHLLEQSEAKIIIGGRHLNKAQAYTDQLNTDFTGNRVSAVYCNAEDGQSLRAALHGVDLLLVASPTTQAAQTVACAALDSKVDYLDVQYSAQKLALLKSLVPEIEQAGRCFITEAGFHPGLPAAMVCYAATHLDRIDTAITAGYVNMGKFMPYSDAMDELMEAFQNYQAQVFKNGRWMKAGSYDIRRVDFGGEIGARQCFSMFFEELRALPEMYPTLKDVGFYISSSHWLVDWVITPLVMMGLKIAPHAARHPMSKLMWWGMQTFPKPPYMVLLKVEATGEKSGKPATFEASISHPDGYELTAIPVVAYLMQYLDGSARHPGLGLMGQLAEPVRLFEDMERMGAKVTIALC